jgi:hypothetical protein
MQFQHTELLGAREKIKQMNRAMEQSAKEREASLYQARQLVHERRNKLGDDGDTEVPLNLQKEFLERELNSGGGGLMMFDWDVLPKLMELQATALSTESQRKQEENNQMEEELRKYGVGLPIGKPDIDPDSNNMNVDVPDHDTTMDTDAPDMSSTEVTPMEESHVYESEPN